MLLFLFWTTEVNWNNYNMQFDVERTTLILGVVTL